MGPIPYAENTFQEAGINGPELFPDPTEQSVLTMMLMTNVGDDIS